MSSDAQALVRQLTENPEVLESMQHMLALLRANPPKALQTITAATTASRSTRARPPRTGYEAGVTGNMGQPLRRNKQPGPDNINNISDNEEELREEDAEGSRGHTHELRSRADRPYHSRSAGGAFAAPSTTTAEAESEELLAASRRLMDAQRRITELEKELQRTCQRVEQLSDVVQKQKSELQDAQDRHVLELEETRHAYEAVVRRKDEVQEEALRQLMKSRQLMVSAAKYEVTVAARRREKENVGDVHRAGVVSGSCTAEEKKLRGSAITAATVGLTPSATGVNTRHASSSHLTGSGVKRERPDELTGETTSTSTDAHSPYMTQQQQQPSRVAKRSEAASWGTSPSSLGRGRQAVGSGSNSGYSHAKTESPEFITSPTPATKASTALVGGGGRTESRSARKRRTPRTPSLTNADRIASLYTATHSSSGGNSNYYSYSKHAANSNSAPSQRQRLPGTNSLKLDSPTPVVSSAWTVGRSLTSSPTPPLSSSTAAAATTTAAAAGVYGSFSTAAMRQQHQQQSTGVTTAAAAKPPLTQRTAGRLATHAAGQQHQQQQRQLAIGRTVPNTRSGTSSVVADGPTRSPSPVNPKRGNAGPRRFIFTGLKDGEPQRLTTAIAGVGDDAAVLASELDEVPPPSTTHIVLRGTPRSVKALCGVVSGKWLVSPEYIFNSRESGFWLDEVEEGGLRVFPPPLQGQRFLLTVEHDGIRAKLAQVVEYGGGEVLPAYTGTVAQDVVVITSGDDLLRYATEGHM
jgi:hypothetical protein